MYINIFKSIKVQYTLYTFLLNQAFFDKVVVDMLCEAKRRFKKYMYFKYTATEVSIPATVERNKCHSVFRCLKNSRQKCKVSCRNQNKLR